MYRHYAACDSSLFHFVTKKDSTLRHATFGMKACTLSCILLQGRTLLRHNEKWVFLGFRLELQIILPHSHFRVVQCDAVFLKSSSHYESNYRKFIYVFNGTEIIEIVQECQTCRRKQSDTCFTANAVFKTAWRDDAYQIDADIYNATILSRYGPA